MMHFAFAKHLRTFLKDECSGDCFHCKWLYPDGECFLVKKLFMRDYRWIPCSERMPVCDGIDNVRLLITVQRGKFAEVRRANFHTLPGGERFWIILGTGEREEVDRVIAWQHEPAAYIGGNDEEDNTDTDSGSGTADKPV